jgi:tetratricopeptide (TPR) repeat protein
MDFFESPEDANNILKSVARFEKMVEDENNYYFDREEFQDIVEYYISQIEFEKAEVVLSYAVSQHPTNADVKILQAQVLIGLMKYKPALELLKELEIIDSTNSEIQLMKGAVYSKMKISDKAIECFGKSLLGYEFKDDVYYLIAVEHQRNIEYKKAIKFFKLALKENPDNEPALFELNMCFDCMADITGAEKFYVNFLDEQPYSETAWFNLAGVYCRNEKWDLAVDAYDFAIAINPVFGSAYFNKANALASNHKYDEAIAVYKETYEHESPNFITFCYIGECYERSQRYEKSLDYYERAIKDKSDHGDAWLGKAISLDALGRRLDSYKAIQRALEFGGDEPDYWYTSSEIEEKLGYIEDAVTSMKNAIVLDDTDPSLRLDFLLLVERHMEADLVKDAIDDAILVFPNNTKILCFKTAYLLKIGVFSLAYETFELVLSINFESHTEVFKFYENARNNQNLLELIDLYRD